ncbi:MAG: hypothetical protein E6G56_13350 [Actinobacteria bacterium]|nr:MAG: hypothetical protein E6G56_13350 [Actinomycetota bacterium]
MTRQRLAALILATTMVASILVLRDQMAAQAQTSTRCPCVILMQVDGLEPKDVTPQTTPFLWALAHPNATDSSGAQQGTLPSPLAAAMQGRAGWIWQAARSLMSTGSAPATAALMTGSTPDRSGVPADAFRDDSGQYVALGGSTADTAGSSPGDSAMLDSNQLRTDSLFKLVDSTYGEDEASAAVVGDPALKPLIPTDGLSFSVPDIPPDPALCPPPAQPPSQNTVPQSQHDAENLCPASDAATLTTADQLLTGSSASKIAFSYIELAEVGRIKQQSGDIDQFGSPPPQGTSTPAVSQALSQADAAIGAFVEAYSSQQPDNWARGHAGAAGQPRNHLLHGRSQRQAPEARRGASGPAQQLQRIVAQRSGLRGESGGALHR